jgi:hypothetical protein
MIGVLAPTPPPLPCLIGLMPSYSDVGVIRNDFYKVALLEFNPFKITEGDHSTFQLGITPWVNIYYVTMTNPLGQGINEKWLLSFVQSSKWPSMTKITLPSIVANHTIFFPLYDEANDVLRLVTSDNSNVSVGVLSSSGVYDVHSFFPNLLRGVYIQNVEPPVYFDTKGGKVHLWVFADQHPDQAITLDVVTGNADTLSFEFKNGVEPPMAWDDSNRCYHALTGFGPVGQIELTSYCLKGNPTKQLYTPQTGQPQLGKSAFGFAELYFSGEDTIFITKIGESFSNQSYIGTLSLSNPNSLRYNNIGWGWYNPSLAHGALCSQ